MSVATLSIWIVISLAPFIGGFLAARWISSQATRRLEPAKKAILADMASSKQSYIVTVVSLVAVVGLFVVAPRYAFWALMGLVLVGNWWALSRYWQREFPTDFKRQSLIATTVFSVGIILTSIAAWLTFLGM